jgi:hypothetical protein
MGNWRTVNISGHIGTDDIDAAREMLKRAANYDPWMYEGGENEELCSLHCLAFGNGICGLHDWIRPSGNINAIGNLYERDFDNDDIEKALSVLARKFPTLVLALHSGDDWESLHCTATFHVKDGECKRCPPEIEELSKISSESMINNFLAALGSHAI